MSPRNERVAVPTNGHHPPLAEHEAGGEPTTAQGTERGTATPPTITPDRGPRAIVPAVSPGQLAAGFGIIAALILLILGRRRGRRG